MVLIIILHLGFPTLYCYSILRILICLEAKRSDNMDFFMYHYPVTFQAIDQTQVF